MPPIPPPLIHSIQDGSRLWQDFKRRGLAVESRVDKMKRIFTCLKRKVENPKRRKYTEQVPEGLSIFKIKFRYPHFHNSVNSSCFLFVSTTNARQCEKNANHRGFILRVFQGCRDSPWVRAPLHDKTATRRKCAEMRRLLERNGRLSCHWPLARSMMLPASKGKVVARGKTKFKEASEKA